ncbi:hypothetical protein SAMN02745181_1912 [Rubritalea squalenifaciens DSM 18772]|uniref:Cytochrome c domain-containing protein n=2 Tax=Rubritalea squalenifaciens TaxID=407226 RepID=A0A1M6ITT6_9BACT|nr:hypothetical protein SAMN02745181_1912 [Rubritalea squalenifaciens DSM 18772]
MHLYLQRLFLLIAVSHSALYGQPNYELQPSNYSKAQESNTISRLQAAMDEQRRTLPGSSPKELLKSLLDELGIPTSSQTLVFSKTSLQRDLITPKNPRAIYFNRDFYVGYVPGGLIEVVACDDPTGMMFYSLNPNEAPEQRKFVRSSECLLCHANSRTKEIPGLLVRSVYPDKEGQPILSWGDHLTTPSSPVSERWGGWYVTGKHGSAKHLGNKWVKEGNRFNNSHGSNLEDLTEYIKTDNYLAPGSDITALMVMEHQIEFHNTCYAAKTNFERQVYLHKALYDGKVDYTSEALSKAIHSYAEGILKVMLFADEALVPVDGIQGSKEFERDFIAAGMEYDGHSLRELRMQRRMFKYRCSYMIFSKSFEYLPTPIKQKVLEDLHTILTSDNNRPSLPELSSREKQRAHAILLNHHEAYKKVATSR